MSWIQIYNEASTIGVIADETETDLDVTYEGTGMHRDFFCSRIEGYIWCKEGSLFFIFLCML